MALVTGVGLEPAMAVEMVKGGGFPDMVISANPDIVNKIAKSIKENFIA